MELVSVVSSNISHVSYNEETGLLTVVFRAGGAYEYEGVPKSEFDNLMKADSIGAYFAKNVRNKYVTRKLPINPVQSS